MNGKKSIHRQKLSINVCYLIDVSLERFIGGGQVHLAQLARQLKARSFPMSKGPVVFTTGIFSGPSPNTLIRLLWVIWVIPEVIFYHYTKKRFSLIHAHSIPAMVAGKILSALLSIPVIITVHGAWMKNRLERFILTNIRYDAQITVSRSFLKLKNINKKILYVPNGIDAESFNRRRGGDENESFLKRAPFRVLFVGRQNDPAKGYTILEKAVALLKAKKADVELTIVGGEISRDVVTNRYRQAHLFVLPSLSEGFPLTLLEAWAAKLPVVATAVGDIPYLVKDGINGFLVPPGDVRALAKAILRAMRWKGLVRLGENGYNLAKRYTWKLTAEKTLEVYDKVLLNEK